jgi:hypothetical protein
MRVKRRPLTPEEIQANYNSHKPVLSTKPHVDEVCEVCGAKDGAGGDQLTYKPCPGPKNVEVSAKKASNKAR